MNKYIERDWERERKGERERERERKARCTRKKKHGRSTNYSRPISSPSQLRYRVLLELPKVEEESFGGPQPVHWHLCTLHTEVHHVAAPNYQAQKTISASAEKSETGLL